MITHHIDVSCLPANGCMKSNRSNSQISTCSLEFVPNLCIVEKSACLTAFIFQFKQKAIKHIFRSNTSLPCMQAILCMHCTHSSIMIYVPRHFSCIQILCMPTVCTYNATFCFFRYLKPTGN